jgi:hypothetical protein
MTVQVSRNTARSLFGYYASSVSAQLFEIEFVSPLEDEDPTNGNVDVHLRLPDGRAYSLLVATPNNIYSCMDNSREEYFFGVPPVFVRVLDREHIEAAIRALLSEDKGKWLGVYGVLQQS